MKLIFWKIIKNAIEMCIFIYFFTVHQTEKIQNIIIISHINLQLDYNYFI